MSLLTFSLSRPTRFYSPLKTKNHTHTADSYYTKQQRALFLSRVMNRKALNTKIEQILPKPTLGYIKPGKKGFREVKAETKIPATPSKGGKGARAAPTPGPVRSAMMKLRNMRFIEKRTSYGTVCYERWYPGCPKREELNFD